MIQNRKDSNTTEILSIHNINSIDGVRCENCGEIVVGHAIDIIMIIRQRSNNLNEHIISGGCIGYTCDTKYHIPKDGNRP